MAIGASGPISLGTTIPVEHGGANPDSLSEYYRNGPYVSSNNTSVPTSGAISLSQFYNTVAQVTVTVTQGSHTNMAMKGYAAGTKIVNASWDGFVAGSGGSRSPTSFNGVTIQGLYEFVPTCPGGDFHFAVVMQGTRAKTWFTSAVVQGGATLTTASSTMFQSASSTCWYWDIPADYATWDGSGARTVTLVP